MDDDLSGFRGMSANQTSMTTENRQREKQAFLSGSTESDIYLNHRRTAPVSPSQEVKAGTVNWVWK